MKSAVKTFKINTEVETIDILTMSNMSDEQYREFIESSGLIYIDHHEVLRSTPASYPIATTREQLDILIEELGRFRERMLPRAEL